MGCEKYGGICVTFNKFTKFSGNIKGIVVGNFQINRTEALQDERFKDKNWRLK